MRTTLLLIAAAAAAAVLAASTSTATASSSTSLIVRSIVATFPEHPRTAVCLAGRESTGTEGRFNPRARSPTDDHGLMQIHRGLETYGPRIYQVWFNLRVARRMYDQAGHSFQPWTGTWGRGMCHYD